MKTEAEQLKRSHPRTVARLMLIVVGMFGFGYAMVPLYSVICDITGLRLTDNGRVEASEVREDEDLSRTVTVEFVANVNGYRSWTFKPEVLRMEVHPGKVYTTTYQAHSPADVIKVAQAVPSISPPLASKYFNKTECFCFTRQEFAPGETRDMPISFIVDRDLPVDIEMLTLSYTFYEIEAGT